jgi:hypothetical protein
MGLSSLTSVIAAILAAAVFNPSAAGNARAQGPTSHWTLNPKLSAVADNTALDLGALNLESPEGEGEGSANRVTDYSGMVYDPHNHRILMFGGGHATTYTDAIYAFDFNTLAWKALYKPTPRKFYKPENMEKAFWKTGGEGPYPRPAARHTYDLLIVPDHRKEFLLLRDGGGPSSVAPGIGYFGGGAGAYDFATGKWERFEVPFGGYGDAAAYDPVSKKIIGMAGQSIYVFDPETRMSKKILDDISDRFKVTHYSGTIVYYPPDQSMYVIPANKEIWKLELDRGDFSHSKITKLAPSGGKPPESECAFAYDPAYKVIGGGVLGGKFYEFNPAGNAWSREEIQGAKCGQMTFHCLVYDPVDKVYIFIGVGRENAGGNRTYAYRARAR